jgi:hypothetical protein
MAEGLQIWDAQGQLVFDTTTRNTRILGIVDIGTGAATGSVTNAGFAEGTPFWFCTALSFSTNLGDYIISPTFSVSGNTLTWNWHSMPRRSCRLIFGTY